MAYFSILHKLCIRYNTNSTPYKIKKKGINMYKKRNYTNVYTEIPPFNPDRAWRDGMISGNGVNGYVESGSPYNDVFIFQHMWFNYPSSDPRQTPKELTNQLHEARQNVLNLNDKWEIKDVNNKKRKRTFYYSFHPGHQLRLSMLKNFKEKNYMRYTDYETGETVVNYTDDEGEWSRCSFTSRIDNVSITKISKSSFGKKINMLITLDDISGMYKATDKMSNVTSLRYKKLVNDDAEYIAQIVHYPSYEDSELKNGGYAGVTRVITEGGTKEKFILESGNENMNVGNIKNPAILIKDADTVYLITESDRTFSLGSMDDFVIKEEYQLMDKLINNTKLIREKYTENGKFNYSKALCPSAIVQQEEFNRVQFNISGDEANNDKDNISLIELQKNITKKINPSFIKSIYEQARFALICCQGSSAPRLCGMWTGEWNPGWRGIYTLDANVNLQVASINTGNLSNAILGYITFFLRNAPDFMENAKSAYNMHDAIQVSVNSDGDRGMHVEYDNDYPFEYWNAGASWCLLPIYEHWQCFGNKEIPLCDAMQIERLKPILSVKDGGLSNEEFLLIKENGSLNLEKDILLPLLTKQANFWEQLCTPEYFISIDKIPSYQKGKTYLLDGEKYLLIPTYSPENHPIGYNSTITANATMDISAAKDGLKMVIDLEKSVKRKGYEEAVHKWENLLSELPEYKIDTDGALCEWAIKDYIENNNHRHLSHLYCAWPAYETREDNNLKNSALIALNNRNKYNITDATAGHGWIHKALVEARLGRGDSAVYSLLPLTNGTTYYSSLMTDHDTNRRNDTYCTDTLLGTIAVIHEMLVFSNTGEIELLPALPSDWKCGSINGIVTRSRAIVKSLVWDVTQKTVDAEITSFEDENKFMLSLGMNYSQIYINNIKIEENIELILKQNETIKIHYYL